MLPIIVIASLSIIGMLTCIILYPRIKFKTFSIETYWIAPLIGAILILSLNLVSFESFTNGLIKDNAINPIEILTLFFSMTLISIVLDETGFFEKLASIVVKKAKTNQYTLFFLLYLLVSCLTIFTSNDIIIITLTPFIIFFCKNTKINPIPYLISEFVAANTWSMLLIIGNPTNIYLGSTFAISFFEYFEVMFVPTVLAGLTSLGTMFLLFRKKLGVKMDAVIKEVHVKDKFLFVFSLSLLSLCIIFMAISSFINIPMWTVASVSCALLIVASFIYAIINPSCIKILKNSAKRLPFATIPFILSMFVFVLACNEVEITKEIANMLNQINNPIVSYGLSSFICANLINNIPMSIFYSSVLTYSTSGIRSIYSVIISSNIAAFLTPLGALAGIMWMSILKDKEIKLSFLNFTGYGLLISIPTLLMAFISLYLVTI